LKECVSILSREFLLNGEMQTPCCCLFIGFSDGSWKKALFDDENYCWELDESDEIPDENKPHGDGEFQYPYKQYLPKEFKSAGELVTYDLLTKNNLVVSFSSGIKLVLSYDPKKECEHIELNT
jgi:hypothetical protein